MDHTTLPSEFDSPQIAMLKWVTQSLMPERLPELATAWIEQGFESPNLAELATLAPPTWRNGEEPFKRVLRDLGVQIVDQPAAGFALAEHWARQIIARSVTPYDGARQIWLICLDIDYPPSLMGFMGAASEREDFVAERVSNPDEYDRLIRLCDQDILRMAKDLVA